MIRQARQDRRGFSIVELSLAMALALLVLALGLWALKSGALRGQTSGAARAVSGFLEQAAAQARARGIPVAVAVTRSPHPSALLLLAGTSKPVLEDKLDLTSDFPGTELAFGVGRANESQKLGLSGPAFDMSTWSSSLSDDRLLVFLPSGEVLSKGIPLHQGGYHLLLSAGLETGPAPNFAPTRVSVPQTVSVSLLGEVTTRGGAGEAFGSPSEGMGMLACDYESSADPPARPPAGLPTLERIEIHPDPTRMERPAGVHALVAPDGYLTLTAIAESPADIPLYCRWTDDEGGRLSSGGTERMTYDPVSKTWRARWHWRPPDGPPPYTVTCKVTDEYRREAIDEVTATLTFDLSNAKQKLLYVAANFEGAAATLISIYEDGVGREQIMPTPPGKAYHIGAWTPDGTKLMLYGNTGGNGDDMYLANSNGSDYHPIEQSNEGQGSAEWSPLGTKICFICPTDNTLRNRREVAVMNADGSDFRQLTSTSGAEESLFTHHEGGYLPGGWSYDEKHIVYGIGNEIWVVDVEAPNATRKVSGSLACSRAGWSPVGNDLYLVSNGDLYRYTPSPPNWPATEPKRVTAGAGVKSFQISPDGGKALFNRTLGGIAMCLLPAAGEDPVTDFQQLSNGSDVCPSWLDNETVSFVRRSGGQPDVYTCSLADLKLTNVTQANHGLFFQGWTPDLSGEP